MESVKLIFALAPAAAIHLQARAAPERIVIGQSVELSGETAGKENMEGALAYFDWLNSQDGVHGKRIELRSYDDRRQPTLRWRGSSRQSCWPKACAGPGPNRHGRN